MARLSDIFSEINATQLWQERSRQADAAAASFNPGQVREMSLVARMYPDIRPGALLALAHNQYRADHPLVQQVGELSAALALREAPAGIQIGQPGATVGMRRAVSNARRDAARAANQPRHIPPPTNPALRDVWEQANVAGLVDGGLFQDPGGDLDSPQQFMYRQVRDAYLEANEPMPTITEEGRPVLLTRGSPLTSGEGWAVKVEPLVEEEPSDRGPGVGPGGINLGVQRAGIAGTEAINAGARAAFMALDAPVQEIQGQVRNLYAATQGRNPDWLESQSDLGVYIGNPDLDAGSGLFVDPESALANERRRREAERGQIGGHNVTAGRWLANTVGLDPDTKPFQLMSGMTDLGVQIADPSGWGLGQAGKAAQARRLFTAGGDAESAAGLIRGLRNVVRPVDAQRWLDSDIGIRSVARLTETTSPTEVWRALNYKVDLDTATRIADTRTVADTRAVVEPMLGTSIREVSTATVGQGRAQFDPRTVMPQRGQIDAWDKNQVAFEVESFLRNAGAEPGYAASYIDKIARARTPVQVNAAIRESLRGTDGLLMQAGVEDEALRGTLTRLHANTHETVQSSVRAAMTNQGPSTAPLMVNGEAVDVLDPVLVSELAPRFLSLPDARAIRRATSDMPNLFKGALWRKKDLQPRVGWAVVEHLQNDLWKPLQLMRAAWTVRVVGEEQLRMAAAGYDSMFNHPLSFISWRTGRKGADEVRPGGLLEEAAQHTNSMSLTHGQWIDTARIPTNLKTTFTKNVHENDRYIPAWGSELLLLHGDPVARQVATSASLDDAVEWFTRGAGNGHRADLAVAYPGKFDSPQQARRYIEGVQNRIHYATGGDSSLLDAVVTGKLDGENLLAGTGLNKKIRPTLEGKIDFAPETVLGSESLAVDRGVRGQVADAKDRAVESLFGVLMTNRTNNLSRSPTFKQAYWREAERLIGFTDEATKATIIAQAREANLGSRAIKRMERIKPRGQATLDEIDLLAKGHGLDETRHLLYDLSQRGRFMDAARVVFPFGEAWKEVLTRWLGRDGLIANNPAVIRRAQQGFQGARGEEFGDLMGAPDGEGFFWCADDATEALTSDGWKRHDEIRDGDLILSLNPDTDEMSWGAAKINRFDFDGELNRWAGDCLDALTTDDHRWLVEDWRISSPAPKTGRRHAGTAGRRFRTTREVTKNHRLVLGGGKPRQFAVVPTHSDEMVELIGWTVTEGYYTKRPGKNDTSVRVYQDERANPEKVHRLRILAKHFRSLGATVTEHTTREAYKMFFFGKGIGSEIRRLAPDKQLTTDFVISLTESQARLLLDTIVDGDGTTDKNGHRSIVQKHQGRLDSFQILAAMLGIRSRQGWVNPRNGVSTLSLYTLRHGSISSKRVTRERYTGTVWCPTVATGVWLSRRNGVTQWTGNSNEFGEEVFLYPGSGLLTEKLLGVEIPLSGSVQGMSMFGTVVPGLGPAVQIPTAWLLKTKPGPQFVREAFSAIETARLPEGIPVVGGTTAREQILPFGSPSESDMGEAANVLNYLPTWMRTTANFLTSGDGNERQWGNAVNSVAAYLATTGDYGTSPGERQRLMEDAAFKARWFMLIKGVAQSTAPSSPSEDWRLVDRNDKSVRVRALAEEYRQLQEDNYGEADRTFLDRYGVDVLAAIQSDTVGTEYGLPTTREGVAWVIANPGVTEDLPHTYGFFAPQGGEFDYSLYAEQFQTGQRHQMSADEWSRLMNAVKGDLQYDAAKLEVGEDADTDDGEAYLREVREWIATTYDGWGDRTGIPQKPETDTLIREMYRAVDNEAVRQTDAGRGLALYLEGRDEVLADAESRGVTLGANEMQGGREYLTELGAWVVGEHPGFKDMFDIIFSRELED